MTTRRQNFAVNQGDTQTPLLTITDLAGTPLDVSSAADIFFRCEYTDSVILTKTLGTSGIALIDGGVDGQMYVLLDPVDTPVLGVFPYQVWLVNALNQQSTAIDSSSMEVLKSFAS